MPEQKISNLIVFGIVILILVMLYACFSAYESAITLIDKPLWMTKIKNKKSRKYRLGLYYINNYIIALNDVLIAETLCSVGATALTTIFFTLVGQLCHLNNPESLGAGVSSGLLTILLLVFGDSIPKTLAKNHSFTVYKLFLFPFAFFYFLFWPISWFLTKIVKSKEDKKSSQDHLKNIVEVMNDEGVIDDESESLIKRTINFSNITVDRVAIKDLNNIYYVYENYTYYEVYTAFIDGGFSRMPVLNKDKHVIGIAILKLFLQYLDPNNDEKNAENFKMSDIMEPSIIVTQNEKIDDVLRKMQLQRTHIAIVVNNSVDMSFYGMLTFEDIIEQIFGPIYDESENDEIIPYEQIDDNTWKITPETNLFSFLKTKFDLVYKIDKGLTIYQFIKQQLKKYKWFKRNQKTWQDKYILISWSKNLKSKKIYFTIKKKDLHEEEDEQESFMEVLFNKDENEENTSNNDSSNDTSSWLSSLDANAITVDEISEENINSNDQSDIVASIHNENDNEQMFDVDDLREEDRQTNKQIKLDESFKHVHHKQHQEQGKKQDTSGL